MFKPNYPSDDHLFELQLNFKISLFTEQEVQTNHLGLAFHLEQVIGQLSRSNEAPEDVGYAIAKRSCDRPFFAAYLPSHNRSYVIVDLTTIVGLLRLIQWIQSLPPIANLLSVDPRVETFDFQGSYLLDIMQKVFFAPEPEHLDDGSSHMYIFHQLLALIISHELTHIWAGHLLFSSSKEHKQLSGREQKLNMQALEFHADITAAQMVFNVMHQTCQALDQGLTADRAREAKRKMFLSYFFALRLGPIFMETIALSHQTLRNNHPPSWEREIVTRCFVDVNITFKYPEMSELLEISRLALVEAFSRLNKGDLASLGHPIAINAIIEEDGERKQIYYEGFPDPHVETDVGERLKRIDELIPVLQRLTALNKATKDQAPQSSAEQFCWLTENAMTGSI